MAQKAFVLVNMQPSKTKHVLGVLAQTQCPAIKTTDYVSGSFDIVVVLEGEDINDITRIVSEKIRTIDGVLRTQTLLVVG